MSGVLERPWVLGILAVALGVLVGLAGTWAWRTYRVYRERQRRAARLRRISLDLVRDVFLPDGAGSGRYRRHRAETHHAPDRARCVAVAPRGAAARGKHDTFATPRCPRARPAHRAPPQGCRAPRDARARHSYERGTQCLERGLERFDMGRATQQIGQRWRHRHGFTNQRLDDLRKLCG